MSPGRRAVLRAADFGSRLTPRRFGAASTAPIGALLAGLSSWLGAATTRSVVLGCSTASRLETGASARFRSPLAGRWRSLFATWFGVGTLPAGGASGPGWSASTVSFAFGLRAGR